METKIKFFEQFYLALAKHKLYIVLTRLPKKQHIHYFFGITFLLALIVYVVPMVSFLVSLGGYEQFFTEKLPNFSIENGVLSIDDALDFRLNQIRVVVDDSVAQYNKEDMMNQEEYGIWFSRSNVVTNLYPVVMEWKYDVLGSDPVNNQSVAAMSVQFYGMVVSAGLVAWLSQMFSYAFLALLFAVCGLGINRLSRANLPFKILYCIALYAETVFALASHLVGYFFTGVIAFIIYFVSAMISMKAVNTGVLMHAMLPRDK